MTFDWLKKEDQLRHWQIVQNDHISVISPKSQGYFQLFQEKKITSYIKVDISTLSLFLKYNNPETKL